MFDVLWLRLMLGDTGALFLLDRYVIFMKYIARCGFTVHGGITLGHGGRYCNTTGL